MAKSHKTATLSDFDYQVAQWLKHPSITSERTRKSYRANLTRFIEAVQIPFDKVTIPDLLTYQSSLDQYAERSQAQIMASIRSFYHFLNKRAITSLNLESLDRHKIKVGVDHKKLLSLAEIEALLEAAKPDPIAYLFIRFLYITGVRKMEALELIWRDLKPMDDGGIAIINGKGGTQRTVFLTPPLWVELQTAKGVSIETDKVFPTLTQWTAWEMVKRLAVVAQIDQDRITVHSFRHACASHMLEEGATLAQVRDQLGHSTAAMTSHYLHANPAHSPARLLKIQ